MSEQFIPEIPVRLKVYVTLMEKKSLKGALPRALSNRPYLIYANPHDCAFRLHLHFERAFGAHFPLAVMEPGRLMASHPIRRSRVYSTGSC